jgi:serine phosphatase RsbU (regulator of sigma subunit)
LWLGIFDRTTDWLHYVSAGHLPPVLATVERDTCLLSEASAPPLGTGEVCRHVLADRMRFSAGALLIVYSDGLIERAGLDLEDQIEMLRGIVHETYVPALSQTALERLVERVLRRLPIDHTNAADDVCILAVHRPMVPMGDGGYLVQRSR